MQDKKMSDEIPSCERFSVIRARGLDFYLGISNLQAEDLKDKFIVNLGGGGDDLREALAKRSIHPAKVVNIDLALGTRITKEEGGKNYEGIYAPDNGSVGADMCRIPLGNETADLCFSVWSLANYLSEERQARALREVLRVLKKGGRCFIYPVPSPEEKAMKYNDERFSYIDFVKAVLPAEEIEVKTFQPSPEKVKDYTQEIWWSIELKRKER